MNELNVHMVQMNPVWEDRQANLSKLDLLLDKHFSSILKNPEESNLTLLPEMFSSGFTFNTQQCAETMEGTTIEWLKNKAKNFNTAIYSSLLINDNNRFYNRGLFVFPDGQIEFYDKRHRFRLSKEPQYISAGQTRKIITYKSWKINLSICYDLRFPVWLRNTFKDGAYEYDILLNVASWPNSRGHVWRTLLQARAMENMAYVIGVNRIGEDQKHTSYRGDSMIIDPRGSAIAVINPDEETIISATLSKEHLTAFREKFAIGEDWDIYEIRN